MDPIIEDLFSNNESNVSEEGLDFWEVPPLVDADLPNNANDVDVEEEERMFRNAEMYTDPGNECLTNKETLFICFLCIMPDIGAPLKT
jgi:hypothetical protein